MVFSATFMAAGIIQLPLQLFWKMEQLSIGLVAARISQIIALVTIVYRAYPQVQFDGSSGSKFAFIGVIWTVLISSITQFIYVFWQAHKILPINIQFSRTFIRDEIRSNRQYGLAYCLSSFHTLAVLILLSNYFPTAQWYTYTGIWALALALIEIFLIIPSALGNSLLHKVANYSTEDKRKSFGNFLQIIRRIGCVIALNLFIWSNDIIGIVWGESYLWTDRSNPGANHILPFLWIVLALSFIKQVFNYLFVAAEKQNVLLGINFIGVIIWLSIGLWAIPYYGIIGGIATQLILEIAFVAGSIITAYRHDIIPYLDRKSISIVTMATIILASIGWIYIYPQTHTIIQFFIYAIIANIIILWLSYKYLRKTARWLTTQ